MIIPCGEYEGRAGRKYLAVYNYQHDVYTAIPPGVNGIPVAHFSYSKGGKKGGVDVFMLDRKKPSDYNSALINVRKKFNLTEDRISVQELGAQEGTSLLRRGLEKAGENYDIQVEVISALPKSIQREVLDLTNSDIAYFCREKTAKDRRGPKIEVVPEIIPKTQIGLMEYNKDLGMIRTGKKEFVPTCQIEGNIDLVQGCVTSIHAGESSNFDGKTFTDFFFAPWGECGYCYSDRKKRNFFKTFYAFDKQRLLEELRGGARINFGSEERLGRSLGILRFGKRTESWSEFTRDSFVQTLEAMVETGTRGIIPTKALPFDREIAKLLKKTKSTVLYTHGWDGLERGACEQEHDNAFRLEQGRLYHQVGVNAINYLMILGHLPIGEREKNVLEEKIPTQILPLRITSKALVSRLIEEGLLPPETTWDKLKGSIRQREFEFSQDPNLRKYFYDSSNLVVGNLHPDWERVIGNNNGSVRMCHHDLQTTYCGGCFQAQGTISETRHITKKRNPGRIKEKTPTKKEVKEKWSRSEDIGL